MSDEYVIRLEDPRQGDVTRMLSALDRYLQSLYPSESNHILDIAALCAPDIRFWSRDAKAWRTAAARYASTPPGTER
jgi:hypothetical protein